jgi:dihydroorotate dehydrogenase
MDPEQAHQLALRWLNVWGSFPFLSTLMRKAYVRPSESLRVRAFGLEFPNPVGLAAGFDKDGVAMEGLASLGFGHLELGTVTPHPQVGNPKPRVFRLVQDDGLINRMGFPNRGADFLLERLRKGKPRDTVIGVNIGKGMETPLDHAAADYVKMLRAFHPYADYVAINVSSPNTLGLRKLQGRQYLADLLLHIGEERDRLSGASGRVMPLLVKLSPDLTNAELYEAVEVIVVSGIDGVIATNTTVHRPSLRSRDRGEVGGLSGAPLRDRARGVVTQIYNATAGSMPIIGVGGISRPEDAKAMLDAGAKLVQMYTGLIYHGPGLVGRILSRLEEDYK